MSALSAAQNELTQTLSPWLQAVGLPLQPLRCGEDPRYTDDFLKIKQDIDKLQGNDYARAALLCQEILANRSKDLRVAGYLLLASVYVSGLPGLLEAGRAYRLILETFWDDCHPQKEGARLSALTWLNNTKFDSYVRLHAEEADLDQLGELRQIIDAVNGHASKVFGDQAPRWTIFDKWLGSRLDTSRPQSCETPKTAPHLRKAAMPVPVEAPAISTPAAAVVSPEGQTALSSERELTSLTRTIRDYLLQNRDDLRAVAFSRALRWPQLGLPPHQSGATRVPAPRAAALNELKMLQQSTEHQALFLLCEKLFLEPGGHLALDLQRLAFTAARALGSEDLARFIADQTAALVRRLPELPGLQFENGQPFADLATRQWIGELAAASQTTTPSDQDSSPWATQLAEQVAKARQLAQKNQLPAALGVLKTCPTCNEKQQLMLQLAMARLCVEAGRPEVAQPVLDELFTTVDSKSLHLWDPDLAIEVWTLHLEVTKALVQNAPANERGALAAKIAELRGKICRTDLEAAARLF